MVYINGIKYACSSCIRGHRSSVCDHENRELFEIKRKGRPVSQCMQVPSTNSKRPFRVKCSCQERVNKINMSSDLQKMASRFSKKNQKAPLEAAEIKYAHEEKQKEIVNNLKTNSFTSNSNGLDVFEQFSYSSDNLGLLKASNTSKSDVSLISNDLYGFGLTTCAQNSGFNSDSSFETFGYNPQYSNSWIYPSTMEQNKLNYTSVLNNIDFCQMNNKSMYTDSSVASNYLYTVPGVEAGPQVLYEPVFLDSVQYSGMQNNSKNGKFSELFLEPQTTLLDDSQNSEAPLTYYQFDCSRVGSKCTCTFECQCINCYTHSNNIIYNTLQNIPAEKPLFDVYINSEEKPWYMTSNINIYTDEP
ncbi:hypothetical protein PORY_001042 [Pneumocystis oryctolagi]|uniref:Uncharacterized protein n=1 Tax=Pneumocystis oryctolagi TaxID=42067 RepID=A0ACB7CD48_9ASCO|nr:hypothetical protein PORY_001042 [Pneumocystis oryctolagi]